MNLTLASRVQALVNQSARWLIGASSRCTLAAPSCILQELGIDSVESRMNAARARAHLKLATSKTWISDLILKPTRGMPRAWVSGTAHWLNTRGPRWTAVQSLLDSGERLTPTSWAKLVKRSTWAKTMVRNVKRQSSLLAYLNAGYPSTSVSLLARWGMDVTRARSFCNLLRLRTGFFWSGKRAAMAKLVDERLATECAQCGQKTPESQEHYLTECSAWGDSRQALCEATEPALVSSSWWQLDSATRATLLLGGQHDGQSLPHFCEIGPLSAQDNWGLPSASVSEGVLNFIGETRTERNRVLWAQSTTGRRLNGMAAPGQTG